MSFLAGHPRLCLLLADVVLVIHFAWVAGVVFGLVLIWVGYFRRWQWVRNLPFRLVHLAAMGFVAWETFTGRACPLTIWEEQLRRWAGGGRDYAGSFMQHWLHRVLFYEAGQETFCILYGLFLGAILLSLWLVPPHRSSSR